jgi:type II secretory pathway pseudopilin PulG
MVIMNIRRHRAGFSLIETVIAVTVASLAFIAILTLSSANARTTASSRDQATATKLVLEAAEGLQSVRDGSNNIVFGANPPVSWNTAWNLFPSGYTGSGTPPAAYTLRYDAPSSKWMLEEAVGASANYAVGSLGFQRRILVGNDTPATSQLKVFIVEVCWGVSVPASCFDAATNSQRLLRQSVKMGQKTAFN